MLGSALLLVLSAATPIKSLAAPGFQCANVDPKVVDSFMVHFAQQLAGRGFQVQTPAEVIALLGLEKQKQIMACTDETCKTEIAIALGVDALITGSMAKIGSGYLINIKIVRATDASAAAVFSGRPKTDDEALDFLEASAARFAEQYRPKADSGVVTMNAGTSGAGVATSGAPHQPTGRVAPWIFGGAAVLALGGGVAMVLASHGTESTLRGGAGGASLSQLQALQSTGKTQELVGMIGLGLGGACAVAAVGLALLGGTPPPAVSVVPLQSGAVVTFGGAL